MTGLGQRTGSNGSLPQQNGGIMLPVQSTSAPARKPSKALLAREKEKVLSRICKFVGRRRVGMLLLAAVSFLVLVSIISTSSKGEDVSEGPGTYRKFSRPFLGIEKQHPIIFQPIQIAEKEEEKINIYSVPKIRSPRNENKIKYHPLSINASILPSKHPCENVVLPPPPMDRKRAGPRPCKVCYIPVEHAMAMMPSSPSISPVLKNLNYFTGENFYVNKSNAGSLFSGHPSLQHRYESFVIRESMTVHCGFFKGIGVGNRSGFDIDEMDLHEMEHCHGVVVASAIFGNYDIIQQPKNIGDATKRSACFYMFVDEETEAYIKNSSTVDNTKNVGLWRLVVVQNLPYSDARRNGKVPKLLLHRLFPNARYSLWIDAKLELVRDPYQILERFLWRRNATFAISRHYRRFDVFEEAEANKAAGKYDNASIDRQIEFYRNEGLTHYTEAKLPITSDVPEGCVIIKEHIPITNLFTCLWFNEVDRFTSRDQISFSTVRDKIMSQVDWRIEMFWDCERRNFVVQAYHKDLLEYMRLSIRPPPPPSTYQSASKKPLPKVIRNKSVTKTRKKTPTKRGKDRKYGTRHHRSRTSAIRDKITVVI